MHPPRLAWLATSLLLAAAPAPPDPIAPYYGNTLSCTAAPACRLWIEPGGALVLHARTQGARTGRWTAQPGAGGATTLCLALAPPIDIPAALRLPTPPAPPWPDRTCLALTPHAVGDDWRQPADPALAPAGHLHLALLPGHQ